MFECEFPRRAASISSPGSQDRSSQKENPRDGSKRVKEVSPEIRREVKAKQDGTFRNKFGKAQGGNRSYRAGGDNVFQRRRHAAVPRHVYLRSGKQTIRQTYDSDQLRQESQTTHRRLTALGLVEAGGCSPLCCCPPSAP